VGTRPGFLGATRPMIAAHAHILCVVTSGAVGAAQVLPLELRILTQCHGPGTALAVFAVLVFRQLQYYLSCLVID